MNTPASSSSGPSQPPLPAGLIGGIGLTEVHVYTQRPAPDGVCSGCPHVHAVTDEGYFVLSGRGRVEFHDLENGFRELALAPGDYVHFPPLVMHRLVSENVLVILGIMGNAGLAERGEARIYFGPEVDAAPSRFAELVSLPRHYGLAGALDRRDAAVRGYQGLMALWTQDRPAYFAELERFFACHCAAIAAKSADLQAQVDQGPRAWADHTSARLALLPRLPEIRPDVFINRGGSEEALGMCGVLRPMLRLEQLAA
ncbi:cupin domain-containing protein [Geminisphaera colitermitum]|uniref:cupin domain-containing protein n=1 Tax=Geminisphaera colitermitum TaxID=1148786 RepID=UPI000158D25A|nr:cupin domain-containing protein [Geminisphaera colitermitum]